MISPTPSSIQSGVTTRFTGTTAAENPTYSWTASGPSGLESTGNAETFDLSPTLADAGTWTITLTINTASCGTTSTTIQVEVVCTSTVNLLEPPIGLSPTFTQVFYETGFPLVGLGYASNLVQTDFPGELTYKWWVESAPKGSIYEPRTLKHQIKTPQFSQVTVEPARLYDQHQDLLQISNQLQHLAAVQACRDAGTDPCFFDLKGTNQREQFIVSSSVPRPVLDCEAPGLTVSYSDEDWLTIDVSTPIAFRREPGSVWRYADGSLVNFPFNDRANPLEGTVLVTQGLSNAESTSQVIDTDVRCRKGPWLSAGAPLGFSNWADPNFADLDDPFSAACIEPLSGKWVLCPQGVPHPGLIATPENSRSWEQLITGPAPLAQAIVTSTVTSKVFLEPTVSRQNNVGYASSFQPDLPGDYVLRLQVDAGNCNSTTKDFNVGAYCKQLSPQVTVPRAWSQGTEAIVKAAEMYKGCVTFDIYWDTALDGTVHALLDASNGAGSETNFVWSWRNTALVQGESRAGISNPASAKTTVRLAAEYTDSEGYFGLNLESSDGCAKESVCVVLRTQCQSQGNSQVTQQDSQATGLNEDESILFDVASASCVPEGSFEGYRPL